MHLGYLSESSFSKGKKTLLLNNVFLHASTLNLGLSVRISTASQFKLAWRALVPFPEPIKDLVGFDLVVHRSSFVAVDYFRLEVHLCVCFVRVLAVCLFVSCVFPVIWSIVFHLALVC